MKINWEQLAQIKELESFFKEDFQGFQKQVEEFLQQWQSISTEDLDKLAILRALEVTNGCTQWAFRRGDEDCLSIEQTRQCMNLSMSSIKNKQIDLANGDSIIFSGVMEQLIEDGRSIFIDAFKNNVPNKDKEFYALSTAQFITYGKKRMKVAFKLIRDNYESYFTDFYLQKGVNYVQPYLDAIDG